MKNIIKIIMVILGILIGAGFASGREIYIFFNKFGLLGMLGICISATITGIIIYVVLRIIKENEIFNYNDMLKVINPKYYKINTLMKNIVNSFLLISFFIMVAAFSAYLNQKFNISTHIASIIFVLICYFAIMGNLKYIMNINIILVPFLIIFILYLGARNITNLTQINLIDNVQNNSKGFLISSILYASYNSIILIPILINMKEYIKNKKDIVKISVISDIIIILLCMSIYGILFVNCDVTKNLEMPLIEITKSKIYDFVIISSIFTSAISAGYGFLKNISKDKRKYNRNLIIVSIISVPISIIGFSNLVKTLYPLFGFLGFLQFCFLIKFIPKFKKTIEKRSKN